MTDLSVVVPVYGCESCLRRLHERLTTTLEGVGVSYELVLVDDRSRDRGWEILQELAAADTRVRALRLSRNFGQHAAITAGLQTSSGRHVVVMDCDLQEPPEEIPRLYAEALKGFDVVYARRRRRSHPRFRDRAARLYFRLLNAVAGTSLSAEYGNFSIISRKVVNAFLSFHDKDRHYLMILNWLGFSSSAIDFEHAERFAGESTYTLRSLFSFAFDGLFFQTTKILRWIVYAGFAISALGLALAVYFVINYLTISHPFPGWTSLGVLLLLLAGFIIVSTGVTGLYIAKIFIQVKDRPLYVVDVDLAAPGATSTAEERPAWSTTGEGSR